MNIAVIGAGYWGPNLIRNFYKCAEIDAVYCFDKDNARLKDIANKYAQLKIEKSYNEILSDDTIIGVVIATPVASHYELAKAALEKGKHVLMEKPMTASVKEAEDLIKIAEKKKLNIMVDHTFVYNGAVQKIKEIIDDNEIGELLYFDAVRINLGLFQHDINVIWDLAPHDLSIMDYICTKQPIAVSATGIKHYHNHEDIAYMALHFDDNCIAHLHANWLAPVKVRTILIGGSQKMIVYDDMQTTEKIKVYDKGIEVTTKEGLYQVLIQYRTGDVYAPNFDTTEPLYKVAKEFIESIHNRRRPLTDEYAGLRVVKILEAAQESIGKKGVLVDLK